MHTGLACVRLSGCQRVVEPPPCPSYIPSDRCLQSFETYRRLNATPRPPLHGCTQPTDPPLFALTPSRATRSPQRAAKYKSGQAVFKTIPSSSTIPGRCASSFSPFPLAYVHRDRGIPSRWCSRVTRLSTVNERQWTTLDRPSSINHLDDPGGGISRFDKRAITSPPFREPSPLPGVETRLLRFTKRRSRAVFQSRNLSSPRIGGEWEIPRWR